MNTGGEFKDKDVIGLRICKRSLLLLEEDNGEVYVCIHQVVRDAIQRLTKQLSETERFEVVHASILSFNQFTIDRTTDSNDFTANEFRLLVPQLRFLSMQIEAIFKENDLSEAIKNSTFNLNYPVILIALARFVVFISTSKQENVTTNVLLLLGYKRWDLNILMSHLLITT